MTGIGGQGIILASDIIAEAAMLEGYDVKKTDSIGMAQRGGSVVSHVRFGKEISSPLIPVARADVLFGMEKLEAVRSAHWLKREALALINDYESPPLSVSTGRSEYPSSQQILDCLRAYTGRICIINALNGVKPLGNLRTLNVFLLGALSGFLPFSQDTWCQSLKLRIPAKILGINLEAFSLGCKEVTGAGSANILSGMNKDSWVRQMFEQGVKLKAKLGADKVFDLSLGNPVMEPPELFKQELVRLAHNPVPGMHRYMSNAGYMSTRQALAGNLAVEMGIAFVADDIVMTCGAAGALNVVLKTILEQGDEIIVICPYFAEYLNYIENHGGKPRIVSTDELFMPYLDEIEAAITARTRGIIINSPNNPTGVVYNDELLSGLARILEAKSDLYGRPIYIISDEPYRRIIYDGLKYVSPCKYYPYSIIASSFSKDLSLPGERIGYIAVNPAIKQKEVLLSGLVYANRILGFVNAPAIMQHLVSGLQGVTVPVDQYQCKRDYIYQGLVEAGYKVIKPQGAFYLFPRVLGKSDVVFVNWLMRKYNILAVPGVGFGLPGYMRLSYCVEDSVLEGALRGLQDANSDPVAALLLLASM
jgi:aspartate aminotransferase